MITEATFEQYLRGLIKGDRAQSRAVIEELLQHGVTAHNVYVNLIWPVMAGIEKMVREDKISLVQEHLATRINRTIVDQLQNKLPRHQHRGHRVVICCAQEELQELGAQMMADLFESDGWEVRFLGGGLTNDDVLAYINENSPQLLIIYGASPAQAPSIRSLIDTVRRVNAWPDMRIMVSGGLFNRAEGLWEEIGADMFASNAAEAIKMAVTEQKFDPEKRTIKRKRKKPVLVGRVTEEEVS